MRYTDHYQLNKPEGSDQFNVEHFNENSTKIDNTLYGLSQAVSPISDHINDQNNPHNVTKGQIGLGNVDNVSTNDQTPTYNISSVLVGLTNGEKLSLAMGKLSKAVSELISHITNTSNPHAVTASQVGLGNVNNTSDMDKPISTLTQAALNGKADSSSLAAVATSGSYNDLSNTPTLGTAASKNVAASGDAGNSDVVMGNDSRLSDSRPASDVSAWAKASTKPTYTASEVGAIATTAKGSNGGVAELDSNGKVPSTQLPSYVDDVIEGYYKQSDGKFYEDAAYTTEITPENDKIYVDISENKTYRWSGTTYVEVGGGGVALGETSETAYRGDRGKAAYDHSLVTTGNPHNVTATDVGLGNVGNFKAVSTAANQGLTSTEQANARANIGAGSSSFSGSYNDLSDKPTLGTASELNVASSGDASSTEVVKGDDSRLTDSRTPTAHTHTKSEITDFPTLANVATSGSYNDLSNKPTIPENTSDLTNDSGFITSSDVPTKTSDLTNDSGFITSSDLPTKTSDLTNDSGFITSSDVPTKTSDLTNDSGFIDYKAVSTVANQGLTETEKANARSNIGAGASSFSGDYNDLTNKPTLGTSSALNVASSGDASSSEVVKGDDSRLTDSRTPTSHTHTTSDVTDFPTLATVATTGAYDDLTSKPAATAFGFGYGTCSTSADTAAKEVTLSGYDLSVGGVLTIKFTYAVGTSATLNVNSKGAKSIYYYGSAITAGIIEAGDSAMFVYDGTYYHLLGTDRSAHAESMFYQSSKPSLIVNGQVWIGSATV